MKVLLVNGSPRKNGTTFSALSVVADTLQENGIDIEYFHIGTLPVRGCIDCKKCADSNRCVYNDDICNSLIEGFLAADGIIIGTPVYFAGPNGALCALLDRVFYAASTHGRLLSGKPAAAISTCYRAGSTAALDRLNKYFAFSEMPMVSSIYWNMIFQPNSSVENDTHGIEILQTLGRNMSQMLRMKSL